jgi:hypothetical protein
MFERSESESPNVSRRGDLDRALAGPAFAVDEMACAAAATVIRTLRIDGHAVPSRRSQEAELLYRISLAAICHSINWDFLSERLSLAFDDMKIDCTALAALTARNINSWLDGYARPDRIRASERAGYLRDIGSGLLERYSGSAVRLVSESAGRLYGQDGFLQRLDAFAAFVEDPLRKKSNLLVHEIVRDRVALFEDQNKIAPAIDYHIMRLYLRSGRVVPLHRETLELLKRASTPRPRLVKLLRQAVSEALSLTALYAQRSIPEVNGIEWQIGRDICDRANPNCAGVPASVQASLSSSGPLCPNAVFCRAYADMEWRMLKEPDLKKSFY